MKRRFAHDIWKKDKKKNTYRYKRKEINPES